MGRSDGSSQSSPARPRPRPRFLETEIKSRERKNSGASWERPAKAYKACPPRGAEVGFDSLPGRGPRESRVHPAVPVTRAGDGAWQPGIAVIPPVQSSERTAQSRLRRSTDSSLHCHSPSSAQGLGLQATQPEKQREHTNRHLGCHPAPAEWHLFSMGTAT